MKQFLLFPTFMLCLLMSFSGYSQYKIDEQRIYTWEDGSPDWDHEATLDYTYENEGDKETSLLTLAMPGSTNITKLDKQYNANNDIISSVMQFWDDTNLQWQDISKTDYEYDGANNLIVETSQSNNFGTTPYSNSQRILYTYSDGNVSSEISQNWNSVTSAWVNNERDLYEYSGSDMTKHTEQKWEAGQWVNEEQTEMAYESAGKLSQIIIKEWNSGINDWEFDERVTYNYNGNLMTEAVGDDYIIGGAWVLDHRTQLTYENGSPTVIIYQERRGNDWENQDRQLYTYDANGNNTILIAEEWDNTGMEWELESKIETDYSLVLPFVLDLESFDTESFKVFPNPASDVIHVSYFQPIEKMELYDVLGKKVTSSLSMSQLNVESITAGMYVLKVYDKNSSTTRKIMIK